MLPDIVKQCLHDTEYTIILRKIESYKHYWDLSICINSPQGLKTMSTVVYDRKYGKPKFQNMESVDTRLANYISELLATSYGEDLYIALEELVDSSGRFGNGKK